jgi:polysaccharide biosynthesis transport protein
MRSHPHSNSTLSVSRPTQPSLGLSGSRYDVRSRPVDGSGLTLLGLLGCVRRRWKSAAMAGAVMAAVAALGVYLFLPPAKPYAYTKLYFPTKPAGTVDQPDPPLNQQTQKELITSRIVLQDVVEDPDIAKLELLAEKGEPVTWLIRDLAVDFPTGSEIMRLTLTDPRVDEAKKIVDKVAEVYMKRIGNEAQEYRTKHLKKLQEMVETARKDLDKGFADGKIGPNGSVVAVSPEIASQRMQMTNKEISELRTDIRKNQNALEQLKRDTTEIQRRLDKTPIELSPSEFEQYFNLHPKANSVKATRDELAAKYELKSQGLGPNNPEMQLLKNQLDAADARVKAVRKELESTIATVVLENLNVDLRKKKDEIAKLEFENKAKDGEIVFKEKEFETLKNATYDSGRFKPGLQLRGTRLEELENKLLKLEAEMGAPIGVKSLEREAVVVRVNDASRRMKMSMIAAVAFFGLTFLAFAFREFRANRVSDPEVVSTNLGLPLMGTVPAKPNVKGGINDREWESVLNEAVDSARTLFLHTANLHNLRTVMVTSAVGGEGKTSLSCRLAASLARTGRRTLLIDADLRNPSVHGQFGIAGGPGVCEILRGEVPDVTTALHESVIPNLWILPAGRCDRVAISQLAQDAFARLMTQIHSAGFDFVLIDSSPILPVADAMLVGRQCDGALLSLMCDVSQVERVNAACARLASIDVPLLGAVVNGTRGETYGYGPRYLAPALA